MNTTRKFIPVRDMPALLERVLGGESLTLSEQRALISSHEELRARFLISVGRLRDAKTAIDEERRRVNEMVSASARMRRT